MPKLGFQIKSNAAKNMEGINSTKNGIAKRIDYFIGGNR